MGCAWSQVMFSFCSSATCSPQQNNVPHPNHAVSLPCLCPSAPSMLALLLSAQLAVAWSDAGLGARHAPCSQMD